MNTNYKIEVYDYDEMLLMNKSLNDMIKELQKISKFKFCNKNTSIQQEDIDWNNYEKDMIKLSKIFKEQSFIVFGKEIDSDNVWTHEFKNGKNKKIKTKKSIKFKDYLNKKGN